MFKRLTILSSILFLCLGTTDAQDSSVGKLESAIRNGCFKLGLVDSSGNPVSQPPSGAASGDLGGSYPNPTVTGLTHVTSSLVLPSAQAIQWNGDSYITRFGLHQFAFGSINGGTDGEVIADRIDGGSWLRVGGDAYIWRTAAGATSIGNSTPQNASGSLSLATLTYAPGTASAPGLTFTGARANGTGITSHNNDVAICSAGADVFEFSTNGNANIGTLLITSNLSLQTQVASYKNINTAGWGVTAVYAATNVTTQSGANASIITYTPTADGDFEVSGQLNVSAATSISTSMNVTYTDVDSQSRTLILPVTAQAGTFLAGGLMVASGKATFETAVCHIRAKANTAITILTATGTFTGVTYSASAVIRQLQ